MRVLTFCDDLYHPAATVRAGLAGLASAGDLEFDWVENARGWDPRQLAAYPVALLAKSNVCSATDKAPWLVGATEFAFRDYVQAGGGLVAVHSGTASYQQVPGVRSVLGGVFTTHPPPGEVTVGVESSHPLAHGVKEPFTVHDEHYQMVLDDAAAEVFMRTRSVHGDQPAGWSRREGSGRVVVLTPGHFPEVWLHPSMQQLLRNALRWAGTV